jgi:hypothetical protein
MLGHVDSTVNKATPCLFIHVGGLMSCQLHRMCPVHIVVVVSTVATEAS